MPLRGASTLRSRAVYTCGSPLAVSYTTGRQGAVAASNGARGRGRRFSGRVSWADNRAAGDEFLPYRYGRAAGEEPRPSRRARAAGDEPPPYLLRGRCWLIQGEHRSGRDVGAFVLHDVHPAVVAVSEVDEALLVHEDVVDLRRALALGRGRHEVAHFLGAVGVRQVGDPQPGVVPGAEDQVLAAVAVVRPVLVDVVRPEAARPLVVVLPGRAGRRRRAREAAADHGLALLAHVHYPDALVAILGHRLLDGL